MESLFTGVRGIGILRTSPFGDSQKFANKVSNITHLGDAPTPIEGYVVSVAWGGTHVTAQDRYLPSFKTGASYPLSYRWLCCE
jgi:hypothetical protein